MDRLSLNQYRDMVDEIIDFKNQYGTMPEYAVVDGCKIGKENYIEFLNTFLLIKLKNNIKKGINC